MKTINATQAFLGTHGDGLLEEHQGQLLMGQRQCPNTSRFSAVSNGTFWISGVIN
jgi:hypothetical protein